MRTAEEVVNDINSARGDGDEQGLRNTAALLEMLKAWPVCPVIHVAGTNGKGSVCAMLNSILTAAGYRTGLYTSPFLQTYRERIRLDSVPIPEEKLAKYGNEVLDAALQLKAEKGYGNTPFELGTALAFHTFRQEQTDIIISETGLGGRLDPTNVIPSPAVCVITAIGMDHMQILGDTLTRIAGEKAGIMKAGVPAVCYPPESEEVRQVFLRIAEEKNVPLTILSRSQATNRKISAYDSTADFRTEQKTRIGVRISLPGEHQVLNALTAIAAADILNKQGISIPEKAIINGVGNTFWPGRMEWCGRILMDGAHNAQGVNAFVHFTEANLRDRKKILLSGVLKEKLSDEMLSRLASAADEAVTVTPDSPRAMRAEELSEKLGQKGIRAHAANCLKEGLQQALELAGDNGIVLATGSLYFIGALRNELGLKP